MAIKPNFTEVVLDGGTIEVHGVSDTGVDDADVLDIQVVLAQGDRVAREGVGRIVSAWQANLPKSDPDGEAGDFQVGDATAFGVETRRENLTTTTWVQAIKIAQKA